MSKLLMAAFLLSLFSLSNSQNTTANVSVSPAIVCPKYSCLLGRGTNQSCVAQTVDGWSVSDCPSNFECRFSFASMNTSVCERELDIEKAETCYAGYIQPNLNCTAADYCTAGFFCDSVTSTCKARSLRGANCTQAYECEANTVCSLGKCVNHFSVPAGNASSAAVACASGIVLNGTCQPAELTNGTLPKVCLRNQDCLATDGKTVGTCRCGASVTGTAYCTAHRSDLISLKQLASTYNGVYEEVGYYTYKLSYFHWVKSEIEQTRYEDCLDEAVEVERFEDLQEMFEKCSPKCATYLSCATELGF